MISVLSGAKHKIAAVCCSVEEDTAGSRLSNTFIITDSHPYVDIVIMSILISAQTPLFDLISWTDLKLCFEVH